MNKKNLLLIAGIIFGSLETVFSSSAKAYPITFACVSDQGNHTTVARNAQTLQTLAVIRWQSQYFSDSGYTPQSRCEIVSRRFQQAYDQNRLNYITGGIVNNQKVICATESKESCDGSNILFTLEPQHDTAQTLQQLFDVRHYSAPPLVRGGTPQYPYIDVNSMLAPLQGEELNPNLPSEQVNPNTVPDLPPQQPEPINPSNVPSETENSSDSRFF